MAQILVGRLDQIPPDLFSRLARYRYEVFVQRLGWELPVKRGEAGHECDQFDRNNTIYIIAHDFEGHICGCARLLPTSGPNLLGNVFPHLISDRSVLGTADVWELSRFSAAATVPEGRKIGMTSARELLAAAVAYAANHRVRRLVGITYLSMERFFRRMGIHCHRAGPPVKVDGDLVLACFIEMDNQTLEALEIERKSTPDDTYWSRQSPRLPL